MPRPRPPPAVPGPSRPSRPATVLRHPHRRCERDAYRSGGHGGRLLAGRGVRLSVSVPSRGRGHGPVNRWVLVGMLGGAALVAVLVAAEARPAWKTTLFAVGTGIVHGVSAALTKTVASVVHHHPLNLLGHWETYALVVVGLGSM